MLAAGLDRALGVTTALDARIGPVKARDRGLSGGEFALAPAAVQLVGKEHLVGFDQLRADAVGEALLPAPVPASTTVATLAARFDRARREGIETACAQVTARALDALPAVERARILTGPVTIDLDAKDVEVFSTRKEHIVRSYKGEISARVHAAHWAQTGTVPVTDLLDSRTVSPDQIDRAVDAVRAVGAGGQILFQGDSGYYSGRVAEKVAAHKVLFRLGVPRSRRSWTVGRDQLALVLDGIADHAWAYSFIATNEPLDLDEETTAAEWEFRCRTRIEELFRDTAHGVDLSHLLSAFHAVNSMWMWGALLT